MMEMQICLLRVTFLLLCVCHSDLAVVDTEKNNAVGEFSLLPNNICPVLECGSRNITVIFLKEDLTKLKVNLTNIHLIDPVCKGFADSNKTISIQSVAQVKHCGTYVIVNQTHVIYKNAIYLKPDPSSVIYREEYVVNVSCIYPLNMEVSLGTVLNPIISTIYINVEGSGRFEVKMAVFKDPSYTNPRQEGDVLSTKDMLYVGVTITEGDTSRFNLVMNNCFATPTQNFNNRLRYYLIENSCQNKNDKTITVAANGIASFGQFSVQAFKFIGGYSHIFLHCQVHLCDRTSDNCVPNCNTRISAAESPLDPAPYLTLGALGVKDPEQLCSDIQCGASYVNVTFKKNDLIEANVNISQIPTNQNCIDFYVDEKIVSMGWPLRDGICGTKLITNATHAIYKNSIYLPPDPSQIIYREDYYINVSCSYPLDMNTSLLTVLNPMISTINISLEGVGRFDVVMAAFQDSAFQTPYQKGEIHLSTKERLFIGVFISKGDTSQFNLVMQHCYATPTNNTHDATNYGIIVNSCLNEEDGTIQVHANGISSEGQFSIQMFKFINFDYVYLHCEVHLCSKSSDTCIPDCSRTKFRRAASQERILSFGPIYRADSVKTTSETPTTNVITTRTTTAKADAGKRTCLDLSVLIAVLFITVIL